MTRTEPISYVEATIRALEEDNAELLAEIERLRAVIKEMVHQFERNGMTRWPIYHEARAALTAQPAAPKQKTEMKLNINAERFLAAVDRDGDHEIGVGLSAQPAAPGGDA